MIVGEKLYYDADLSAKQYGFVYFCKFFLNTKPLLAKLAQLNKFFVN